MVKMQPPTLIVALDVDNLDKALVLRDRLIGVVDTFKVGKELFTACGPAVLDELAEASVFLDLKFHDIPNTVAGAVRAAAVQGVGLVDVHTLGGRAMMEAAMAAARDVKAARPLVFGVTVLTHLSDDDLSELGMEADCRGQALRLARLAADCGLDGVVASAHEIETIRKATEDRLALIVPGVRPAWASESHDQKRVATPAEVARAGARYVVVGRAITHQSDPRAAASRIRDELESA